MLGCVGVPSQLRGVSSPELLSCVDGNPGRDGVRTTDGECVEDAPSLSAYLTARVSTWPTTPTPGAAPPHGTRPNLIAHALGPSIV